MTVTLQDPFVEARIHFQPSLPRSLQQIENVILDEGVRPLAAQKIQSLFPKICNQPIVHLRTQNAKKNTPLKVGVVLSGGQAAGGHNVIAGLLRALKKWHPSCVLFGFLGGPSGILKNDYKEMTDHLIAPYLNTGGFDLIGSGRTKIETEEHLELAKKNCTQLNLDGLVIIGGDDSNTNAAILAEYFLTHGCKTRVIGVPKTIDGDLKNAYVDTSFGFDTACKIYSQMIGNICRDALSAKKYTHFIKLMGRSASHIALECALQTHANLTFIGEEVAAKNMTLKEITETICNAVVRRANEERHYGVILIPEGLIEFVPEMKVLIQELNTILAQDSENVADKLSKPALATLKFLPKEIGDQLLLDRDPHGNVQVSHINTEQLLIHSVRKSLQEKNHFKSKFSPVGHFFGYEGRCGYPSNFDANYCYALGFTAAALIGNGVTGYMSAIQKLAAPNSKWEPMGFPLTAMMDIEERKGKQKPVIKKALVDLEGTPYKFFASHREQWMFNDDYQFPGPIQFYGPPEVCDAITHTLTLELQ